MPPEQKCPSCGAPLAETAGSACPHCGSRLNPPQAEPTALELRPTPAQDTEPEVILEPGHSAFYNPNAKPAFTASFRGESHGQTRTFSGRWAISCGAGGAVLLCLVCCGLPLALTFFGILSKR